VRYGEFDHVVWVTMKKDGPLLANVMLDGILPENLQTPESDEPGVKTNRLATVPVKGRITLDGKPLAGVTVTLLRPLPPLGTRTLRADALTEEDGTFVLSTYTAGDGAPVGSYRVTVARTGRAYYDGDLPKAPAAKDVNVVPPPAVPAKYTATATTPLTAEIREGLNEVLLDLTSK
jgi:hypothetical protein